MDVQSYKSSLSDNAPPHSISVYLEALWHDAKGNWEASHKIIQEIDDNKAAWIHAYLHRKEGDIFNADYWYRRAGKKRPTFSLQEEWQELVESFI
jgi:hypothetical protein